MFFRGHQTNQTGGKDPQMVNLYNAARVMKVFAFHKSTDLYGDIPYSEANKAYDSGYLLHAIRYPTVYLP